MNWYKVFPIYLLFILSGCAHRISYTSNEPPAVNLGQRERSVLLTSKVDSLAFDFNQDDKVQVFRQGYKKMVFALVAGLREIGWEVKWGEPSRPLPDFNTPPEEIASFCQEYGVSMLAVIDTFSLDRIKEVEVVENDDGTKNRKAHFLVNLQVPVSLYDDFGTVLSRILIEETRHLSSRFTLSGALAIGPSLGNREKEIYPLCEEVGLQYAENFKPHEVLVFTNYFANKDLKQVKKYVEKRAWDKAIQFCKSVYEYTSDEKLKSKAAHNLFVFYSIKNEYTQAENWKALSDL